MIENYEALWLSGIADPTEVTTFHFDLTSPIARPRVAKIIMVKFHLAGPRNRDTVVQKRHKLAERGTQFFRALSHETPG